MATNIDRLTGLLKENDFTVNVQPGKSYDEKIQAPPTITVKPGDIPRIMGILNYLQMSRQVGLGAQADTATIGMIAQDILPD